MYRWCQSADNIKSRLNAAPNGYRERFKMFGERKIVSNLNVVSFYISGLLTRQLPIIGKSDHLVGV